MTTGNTLQLGVLHNTPKAALSLKTGVNLDEVREKGTLEEIQGELSGVVSIAPRVSAQVNAVGHTNLKDITSAAVKDLQFTLAYHSPGTVSEAQPKFETALSVSNFGKHLNFTYYQHLVRRRKIYNVWEGMIVDVIQALTLTTNQEHNVTQIVNYLDLGMEVDLQNVNGKTESRMDVGAGWQANKNLVLKGKVGSSGVSGVMKFKTWGSPKVCGSLCAGVDWDSNPRFGFNLRCVKSYTFRN